MKRAGNIFTAAVAGLLALALTSSSPALAAAAPSPPGGTVSGSSAPANAASGPKSVPAAKNPGPVQSSLNPDNPGDDREANKEAIVTDDASASRNAARTRMRECGHQWSTMKKSGAATGMTWKDYSQSCLARK